MSREKEIERLKELIATHSSFDIIAHTSIVFGKRFMIDGFNVTFSELEFNDLMQTNGMQFGFEDAKPKNFRFKLDDHKQDNSGNNDIDGFTMKEDYSSKLYDCDTSFLTPNFFPGMYCITPGKECYVDTYLYDEFITDRDSIPYHFALINNGKIVAIGNEYGREGGVTDCCKDACFASNVMKSKIYPFVKDYPIGTVDDWQDPMLAYCNTYEDLIKLKNEVLKNSKR